MFETSKKKIVYLWELNVVKDWTVNEIRNRIWMAKELGQSIPGCVSVEALRIELLRRKEEPCGFHENLKDVDISMIEVECKKNIKSVRR